MTEIIAAIGDTHTNSKVGLCAPDVTLDDGDGIKLSRGQWWLWECWQDYCEAVDHEARTNTADVTTIINGDAVDGDTKGRSTQVFSRNEADIIRIASAAHAPLIALSKRTFVTRGTPAHSGKSGVLEELFAADVIGAVKDPSRDTFSWWELSAEIGGILIDAQHHGPLGRAPWTAGNPLSALATRLMLAYAGRRLPDLALRSHNHRRADTFDNYPVRVIALSAWQLATEYVHRLGLPEVADIGGIMVITDGGAYEVIKKNYVPQPRKIWTLTPSLQS